MCIFYKGLSLKDMEKARLLLSTSLRGHRKRLGFKNQAAFAEHCNVSADTIKKVESGAMWPGPAMLEKLADGCGVSISELMEIPESPKRPLPTSFHLTLRSLTNIPEDILQDLSGFPEGHIIWKLVRIAIRRQRDPSSSESGEKSG